MSVALRRFLPASIFACLPGCVGAPPSVPQMTLEERLIFHPKQFTKADERPRDAEFEDAWIDTRDGCRLHGWYQGVERPTAVILYCHGNAGNIASRGWVVRLFRRLNCSVLVFDYRGYGKSNRVPSEAGVLQDARAARKWLARQAGVSEKDVVLVGTSLGGAVCVDLAAKDGARGLVLGSTFTSLPDVASAHLLGLPTRWLMNARLDSASKIASYHGPLFQTHGDADGVVPFTLGKRLFEAANEPKQFISIPGGGHNDPPTPELVAALRRFLEGLPQVAERRAGDVKPPVRASDNKR